MALALVKPSVEKLSGYGSGYSKPKEVIAQIAILDNLWPSTWITNRNTWKTYPDESEGPFVSPRWDMLVPRKKNGPGEYALAVKKVLEMLGTQRKGGFENRCTESGLKHLRQSRKSKTLYGIMGSKQMDADFIVVPGQFGAHYQGRSVVEALHKMEKGGVEIGLGAYDVGCMLLTHPERLSMDEDMGIDCAGDLCSKHDLRLGHPCFFVENGKLVFDVIDSMKARAHFGSASCWIDFPRVTE